jgi:hypothetical protein
MPIIGVETTGEGVGVRRCNKERGIGTWLRTFKIDRETLITNSL